MDHVDGEYSDRGTFMIRILIDDDHAIIREGLKQIVTDMPNLVVTGEAENGKEVLARKVREVLDQ